MPCALAKASVGHIAAATLVYLAACHAALGNVTSATKRSIKRK